MVLSWLRQQEHLEPPGPEAASAYLSPLLDSQAQLLSRVCVWWLQRRPVLSLYGLPSFPGPIKQQQVATLATVGGTLPTAWAHS